MHPLSSDLPSPESLVVPDQPTGPLNFVIMTSNPVNQSLEDQFLRWRQKMEAKQEEQARQMAELQDHATRLQQENDHLRTRLEANQGKNIRGHTHPAPPVQPSKGKEPILPSNSDPSANDKLSSNSSPLLDLPPPQNNVEAKRRSSQSVSGMLRRIRREVSRDKRYLKLGLENMPSRQGGMAPPLQFIYHTTGAPPVLHLVSFPAVRGPKDMLSSPLGQHILSYKPPRGFAIPPFAMYDGSVDPYDHMLHFNQVMILSAGNDRLLCKVFLASLKGPALAWFHKLLRGSINSFNELWAAFVSQYLCLVRQKESINSLKTIYKREDESIRDFTRRFGQVVQQIDAYNMDAVVRNFRRSFGPTTPFF